MRREHWRDREEERHRRLRPEAREDYGQADYSDLYGYDPHTRSGYRAYDDGRRPLVDEEPRHFDDRSRRGGETYAYEDHPLHPHDARDHRGRRAPPA